MVVRFPKMYSNLLREVFVDFRPVSVCPRVSLEIMEVS